MAAPNSILVRCSTCKIATTCPRRGSSPLSLGKGKGALLCRVVGGYSRDPVSPGALSKESLGRSEKDGPCLTLVEVPTLDPDSGHAYHEVVKVFHHPIRHPRERSSTVLDAVLIRSHAREKKPR